MSGFTLAHAARAGDPVHHSHEFLDMLKGMDIGLFVGAVVVGAIAVAGTPFTGGASLILATVVIGGSIGQIYGSYHQTKEPTGYIVGGAVRVRINGRFAARAVEDGVNCQGTPPVYIPSHEGYSLAEGVEFVLIGRSHAARIGDKVECGAKIGGGSPNVAIGGRTVRLMQVDQEVPEWVNWVMIGASLLISGPLQTLMGYYLSKGAAWCAKWLALRHDPNMSEEDIHRWQIASNGVVAAVGFGLGEIGSDWVGGEIAKVPEISPRFAGYIANGIPGIVNPPKVTPAALPSGSAASPPGRVGPAAPAGSAAGPFDTQPILPADTQPILPADTQPIPPASSPSPEQLTTRGDPVDVASGRVLHHCADLPFPGAIPLAFWRDYTSAPTYGRTAMGLGGWTHSLEQWVAPLDHITLLRDEHGRDLYFPVMLPGERQLHRASRTTLEALDEGGYTATCHATGLTRRFAPVDASGRAMIREVADADGNKVTWHHEGGQIRRVGGADGTELRIQWSGGVASRVELWSDGVLQRWVDYTYDGAGRLGAATDALGAAESYGYDASSRLVQKTRPDGVAVHYEYDPATGWCRRTWGDQGPRVLELDVDLQRRIATVTGDDEPRVYHYNESGLVTREEAPGGRLIHEREYDSDMFLVSERNGAGELTLYEYDDEGELTRTERSLPRR